MQRILIVSDSHGNAARLQKIIDAAGEITMIIHCGDGAGDLLDCEIPARAAKVQILGNVDLWHNYSFEREEVVDAGDYRFFVTHGDLYNVKGGFDLLIDALKEKKCHGAFFGHTHKKFFMKDEFFLFNPGSASHGAYGILELDQEPVFTHKTIS